jgi:hypothetical protein
MIRDKKFLGGTLRAGLFAASHARRMGFPLLSLAVAVSLNHWCV